MKDCTVPNGKWPAHFENQHLKFWSLLRLKFRPMSQVVSIWAYPLNLPSWSDSDVFNQINHFMLVLSQPQLLKLANVMIIAFFFLQTAGGLSWFFLNYTYLGHYFSYKVGSHVSFPFPTPTSLNTICEISGVFHGMKCNLSCTTPKVYWVAWEFHPHPRHFFSLLLSG